MGTRVFSVASSDAFFYLWIALRFHAIVLEEDLKVDISHVRVSKGHLGMGIGSDIWV